MSKTVQVYNLDTEEISTIIAPEPAPGMVEADAQRARRIWESGIAGQSGRWLQTYSVLGRGSRHDPTQEQTAPIKNRTPFGYTVGASLEERRDVFRVLVASSMSPREQVRTLRSRMVTEKTGRIGNTYYGGLSGGSSAAGSAKTKRTNSNS